MLVYVYSGELTLVDGKETSTVGNGECVFLRRNHQISMKDSTTDGHVDAMFIVFTRKYLKEYYRSFYASEQQHDFEDCKAIKWETVKL